ncbi:MAG: type II toxin-antitoxin system YoeB family toxin [Treponema sp.]|jgi:hypothetical protein|nr:type II toxin-antitoxin system YoeB family toxin [Treponema sp.]
MSSLSFLPEAWEDYVYWQGQDKKTLKKINEDTQEQAPGYLRSIKYGFYAWVHTRKRNLLRN